MRNRPLEKGILGVGAFVKKTKEQISFNMKRVKNKDSEIEITLRKELWARGLRYRKNVNRIFGKPDIAFIGKKIAVFCGNRFVKGRLPWSYTFFFFELLSRRLSPRP